MSDKRAKVGEVNLAEEVVKSAAEAFGGKIGGLLAQQGINVANIFASRAYDYWFSNDEAGINRFNEELKRQRDGKLPPFMIIGLGRCGSHVTSKLAQIVASRAKIASEHAGEEGGDAVREKGGLSFWSKWRGQPDKPVVAIEPMMIVGDIDESTFGDINKLLQNSPGGISERILVIDYDPLARGGVGHVPVFAEFLTRGLLALPPNQQKTDPENGVDAAKTAGNWEKARSFLIDSAGELGGDFRLANYVFSAGGGTGSGAASELLRAQRVALLRSGIASSRIYFNGVAVVPTRDRLRNDQTQARNTGRLFIKYLSELNIQLKDHRSFLEAPDFLFSTIVRSEKTGNEIRVGPWNALALVSNDLMTAEGKDSNYIRFEQAENVANYYIAQQLFNISSAQLPIDEDFNYENFSEGYFSSIRLDPEDLVTGLMGPYAIGYAEGAVDDFGKGDDWIERLFGNAISSPVIKDSVGQTKEKEPIVEGISISPLAPERYKKKLEKLSKVVQGEKIDENALRAELEILSQIPFFRQCPRVVIVFTAPPSAVIPANVSAKLEDMASALLPNNAQKRLAIIRGTTNNYTLSVFFEASAVLTPDIYGAVRNYIWLCWANRDLKIEEFKEKYENLFDQSRIITEEDIADWIVETEDFSRLVGAFDRNVGKHERAWTGYLENTRNDIRKEINGSGDFLEKLDALQNYSVEGQCINRKQLVSALNYIMYVRHYGDIGLIGDDADDDFENM